MISCSSPYRRCCINKTIRVVSSNIAPYPEHINVTFVCVQKRKRHVKYFSAMCGVWTVTGLCIPVPELVCQKRTGCEFGTQWFLMHLFYLIQKPWVKRFSIGRREGNKENFGFFWLSFDEYMWYFFPFEWNSIIWYIHNEEIASRSGTARSGYVHNRLASGMCSIFVCMHQKPHCFIYMKFCIRVIC